MTVRHDLPRGPLGGVQLPHPALRGCPRSGPAEAPLGALNWGMTMPTPLCASPKVRRWDCGWEVPRPPLRDDEQLCNAGRGQGARRRGRRRWGLPTLLPVRTRRRSNLGPPRRPTRVLRGTCAAGSSPGGPAPLPPRPCPRARTYPRRPGSSCPPRGAPCRKPASPPAAAVTAAARPPAHTPAPPAPATWAGLRGLGGPTGRGVRPRHHGSCSSAAARLGALPARSNPGWCSVLTPRRRGARPAGAGTRPVSVA